MAGWPRRNGRYLAHSLKRWAKLRSRHAVSAAHFVLKTENLLSQNPPNFTQQRRDGATPGRGLQFAALQLVYADVAK
jgi:hypothetical protein